MSTKVSVVFETGWKSARIKLEGQSADPTEVLDALVLVSAAGIRAAEHFADGIPDENMRKFARAYFASQLKKQMEGPSNATGKVVFGPQE